MYKLMILISSSVSVPELDEGWPEFLRHAEMMPGLQREATVQVTERLYGAVSFSRIHELFFEDRATLHAAMSSPAGLDAGEVLQRITRGQMTLLIVEHSEDSIENLVQYHSNKPQTE